MLLYYSTIDTPCEDATWNYHFKMLSPACRKRNLSYGHKAEKKRHLLGRLLLNSGFQTLGASVNPLENLQYNIFNRPFVEGDIDFNISAAGKYVICAMGRNIRLGIDVEPYAQDDITFYKHTMSDAQWQEIILSEQPGREFINRWTVKESVMKAIGHGIYNKRMENIIINAKAGTAHHGDMTWYLHFPRLDGDHQVCLASDHVIPEYCLQELNFF
ncbi:4'-phosphopantetheinyl transferase family protein [Chitinophaga sp. LS1]|uniref:4'-phosphopantetheinyl transferase family protein n=1 Tax=Chitinophaga sp. LS1 TaxID=3051176 RepID=UPI002AABA23B|nr:4'-phosphopantetheinyl transferase superfamily protein [Chitinophaga sp. LS1]WPV66524.1 4'-phosphopantetheinyl transferase superfamily protein [Chitinophaga sp. LS1]